MLFRRAFLSEIDQKLAAVRFDQFVRGERLHERPDPSISYPINYQPFDVHLPSGAIDPRDQAKRNCDPIPFPLVSSSIHNMHFIPAVVFRLPSPHSHHLRAPFATDLHLTRCVDILRLPAFLKGSCILFVDSSVLGDTCLCPILQLWL